MHTAHFNGFIKNAFKTVHTLNWAAHWFLSVLICTCMNIVACLCVESVHLCLSCVYTSLPCTLHIPPPLPFCSKGQSVPKDFPIILSTLPSWWHQIDALKENLVHPHPDTYTHLKENKEHCFIGLYVYLPVCYFGYTSLFSVTAEREWLHCCAVDLTPLPLWWLVAEK